LRFFLDGWLNVLYLTVFVGVVYILRPTANNRRFAMSDELRQEDDDFDLGSLHDLELAEGDPDADIYNEPPPERPPVKRETGGPGAQLKQEDEDRSKLLPRQSEDGADFSIGDDEFGNWADDDDEDDDEDTY
jgi:hypothetical protein